MKRGEKPFPGRYPVAQGEAELLRDADRDNGWVISIRGVPQSYLDLDDPTHLNFEYMRLLGDVVDRLKAGPLDAVHIGGAGCTLARYVAATRPGSRQIVYELDEPLVRLVREHFPLKSVRGLKVRVGDGRQGLAALPDASDDLLVLDAFSGAEMPVALASAEFTAQAARVLRDDGVYVANVADGNGLGFARRLAATVAEAFPHTLLLGDPGVLRGRRFGNLVLAGSRAPLPVAELVRVSAGKPLPARCMDTAELARFSAGHRPIRDGDRVTAPVPPPALFGRS
ncbi:spermidine synthase [Actinocorallia populi]|uniref:spermidine synthase n=1 Tax=Actinocorallia populi TaxID=2079200 RepID=UPI000D08FA42|nr:fused MFS/spermidine synthase [Actinocorallia populi]